MCNTFLMLMLPIIAIASQASAHRLVASSGSAQVQLIELYSSESCSSCPPADKWISTLKERSELWKAFVPVVFHVDYWNNLGWKDALSSSAMTQRQRDVAQTWTEPSVYTPAVVVDGQEWRSWSGGGRFPSRKETAKIRLSVFEEKNGTFQVFCEGLASSDQYTVRIAKLGMDMNSNVTAGENSGHLLSHNFVVLDWASKSVNSKTEKVSFQLNPKTSPAKSAIAVWIEKSGKPLSLQAAGGYL